MKTSTRLFAVSFAAVLGLSACGGSGFDDTSSGEGDSSASGDSTELSVLIASSGDAETNAVQSALGAWSKESGTPVKLTVASDMPQELAQGFASGNPADVFYMEGGAFATNAAAGNLHPYEAQNNDDFYEPLRQAFTYEGQQYCAPKDYSSLALVINKTMWEAAGLTDADLPTTYDELQSVAEKLTTDGVTGLVMSPGYERAGAFVVSSGGWWMNADNTEPAANTPQVIEGLTAVQKMLNTDAVKFSSEVDTGWGGEAFGTQKAAMTIEGNWIKGALANDYPDVQYFVAELPEGSAGKGTLLFTQCWGVAADSDATDQAVDLVNYLTSADQQMAFADAFGVMPSRVSASEQYAQKYPEDAAFVQGGEYGHGPINVAGITDVVTDLNSQLENLKSANIAQVVESFDNNVKAAMG